MVIGGDGAAVVSTIGVARAGASVIWPFSARPPSVHPVCDSRSRLPNYRG